jgi:EmrB/QacA subfamily drug resistance transporter
MTTDTAPGLPQTEERRGEGLAVALVVAAAFFIENLDGTVITTAMPTMAVSFGVDALDLNIGVSAYLLTLGVLIPASGWLADRLGTRTTFSIAVAIFTLASLACGFAGSLAAFTALRVLQGVGGAMMVPVGRLAVLRTTPKARLVAAIATLTWPGLVAPILGPPVGGFITAYADWRWIFFLNVPLGLAILVAALALFPSAGERSRDPFDWVGFATLGIGLFALTYAADAIGRDPASWGTGLVALAGLLVLALGIRHLRRARHPMIDLGATRIPTFAVSIYGGSLFRMAIGAIPYLLPLLFQIGFGLDAFRSGLLVIAVFAGNLAMKPFTTAILRRVRFRPLLVATGLVNAAAIAACALLTPTTPLPVLLAVLFVGGLSRSMQFTAFNTIAFADVPAAAMRAANTLFSTAFQLAMGLGIALGAIALRAGSALVGADASAPPLLAFRIAFLAVAAVALLGLVDSLRLDPSAGDAVRPRR